MLDIKSCDRCAGCPGYGVNRSSSRARGGGGDRRALGPGSRQGSGGTTKTDDAGACVSSPASRITRGKDHPTARLSGPCPGKVWHRAQELAGRARKRLACGGANRDARSPSKGQQERHRLASQPACSWDGQSLVIEAGENCPSDAQGEALPVVVLAPRA